MFLDLVLAAGIILVVYLIIKRQSNQIKLQEQRLDKLKDRVTSLMDTLKDSVQLRPQIRSDEGREQRELNDQEIAESIVEALTNTPPQLERVYTFSMQMTREFSRDTVGISDEGFSELQFWPAAGITIEKWNTHLVVYRYRQYGLTVYEPDINLFRHPIQLWFHTFSSKVKGPTFFDVVLDWHAIECRGNGRSFIKIPLQARELEKYLRTEVESDDPEPEYKHTLAYREYYHEDPSGFGWHLSVRDMVAFKAEDTRYKWGLWR